jgi:hypothetical protein
MRLVIIMFDYLLNIMTKSIKYLPFNNTGNAKPGFEKYLFSGTPFLPICHIQVS